MRTITIWVIISISTLFSHAQNYYGLDMQKIENYCFTVELDDAFVYDTISWFNGYLITFKNYIDEFLVSINSLEEVNEIRKDDKLENIKIKDKKYLYYANDYISVLYYDLPKHNVSVFVTTYLSSKEELLKIMENINPDEMIRQAKVK